MARLVKSVEELGDTVYDDNTRKIIKMADGRILCFYKDQLGLLLEYPQMQHNGGLTPLGRILLVGEIITPEDAAK